MAVGLGQLVQLKPVPGFHVYVAAPEALSTTLSPLQIAGVVGFTVTFSEAATVTTSV